MEVFVEIFQEAMQAVNLPLTGFLTVCMLYWGLVLAGCLGHGDADAGHLDAGGDLHADTGDLDLGHGDLDGGHGLDAAGGLDVDAGHVDLHGAEAHSPDSGHDAGASPSHGWASFLQPWLRFMHLGEVPLVPLLSLMALSLWMIALWSNHMFNPEHRWGRAALLFVPNLAITSVFVHFLALPLKKLFRALNRDPEAPQPIVGSICRVITQTASAEFGAATIECHGAPLQIHVRTIGEEVLKEGDHAVVISENATLGTYNVTGLKAIQHKLEQNV